MTILLAVWTFLKSPIGRYLLIGLAFFAVIFGIFEAGRQSGIAHERKASDKAIAVVQANYDSCQKNEATQESAIQAQNASIAALKADSDQRAKTLSDALVAARKTALTASQRADKLLALKPKGADVCARVLDVDKAVLEGLK